MSKQKSNASLPEAITRDEVIRSQKYAETLADEVNSLLKEKAQLLAGQQKQGTSRMPESLTTLQEVQSRMRKTQIERIRSEWMALQAELQFAAQGGAALINHPGYRGIDTMPLFFLTDLEPDDLSECLQAAAGEHESRMAAFLAFFEQAIVAVDAEFAACHEKKRAIRVIESRLNSLREQRRQAFATGENTAQLDKAIADANAEHKQKTSLLLQTEDEIEGLNLRRTALQKALDAAQAGQDSASLTAELIAFCRIAAEYNRHAEAAARLFESLYESENSVFALAKKIKAEGWQQGIPGIRYTPYPDVFFNYACCIPRIRVHWPKGGKSQEGEAYFYRTTRKLAAGMYETSQKYF